MARINDNLAAAVDESLKNGATLHEAAKILIANGILKDDAYAYLQDPRLMEVDGELLPIKVEDKAEYERIVMHIEALMGKDPSPDSHDGKILNHFLEIVKEYESYLIDGPAEVGQSEVSSPEQKPEVASETSTSTPEVSTQGGTSTFLGRIFGQ